MMTIVQVLCFYEIFFNVVKIIFLSDSDICVIISIPKQNNNTSLKLLL
jgi:hypothetical protein